jgi:hypothetical protein
MLSPNQGSDEQKLLPTSMKGRNLKDKIKEIITQFLVPIIRTCV